MFPPTLPDKLAFAATFSVPHRHIEVKYRTNMKQTGLSAFRRAFPDMKSPVSVVITKDRLDREQDTLFIPFWLAR